MAVPAANAQPTGPVRIRAPIPATRPAPLASILVTGLLITARPNLAAAPIPRPSRAGIPFIML